VSGLAGRLAPFLFANHDPTLPAMLTFEEACDRCKRRNPISYQVSPADAWGRVVLNRWRTLCPSCFDELAEMERVKFRFVGLTATAWADRPRKRGR
jgi:hypothetical protein